MGMFFHASVKMQNIWICFLMALFMPALSNALDEQATLPEENILTVAVERRAMLLDIQGPIGPATAEYLINSLEKSTERNAELVDRKSVV